MKYIIELSGRDIGKMLGIDQSTIARHIRTNPNITFQIVEGCNTKVLHGKLLVPLKEKE